MGVGTNTPLVGSIRAYAGAVTDSGATEVPSAGSGWFLCNGAAISRTTYDDLFALVGTTYGVGDGSTTFNLPDMRGRFPIGLNLTAVGNINSGVTGGVATQTLAVANLPVHAHTVTLTAAGTHSHTDTSSAVAGDGGNGYHEYYIGFSVARRDGNQSSLNVGVNTNGPNGTTSSGTPSGGVASSANDRTHTHNVTLPADSTYAAAHTLTITAVGTGATPAHENMPPYIALNFVIKI